ncbi:hypothetical protein OEV98_10630 [Caldibacillus lycopersici]|uniref:Uncharacterized protein n=1 Tax=Perspicuibacillus lycopersici TaxID=1325689 RepID=A0AAE3IVA1_9BACI|nr:hypothetical protein [Perspicuibacillus lycopersici]MCU9614016.1 hypothetical protein [Perspicuibacillus lycopersici]
MDKLPKGNGKVTIKINGKEKDYEENLEIYNWRDAQKEMAASEEPVAKNNDYSINNITNPFKKRKKIGRKRISSVSAQKQMSHSTTMVIIASISAITIGILIGFILLQVMGTGKNPSQVNGEDGHAAGVNGEQMILPAVDIYFLQEGVYSNEDSVKSLVAELNAKNQPAAYVKSEDNIHVLVTMVDSLDSGKAIQKNTDYANYWPKQLTIKEKIIQNLTSDEKKFFESAFSFYDMLIKEGTTAYIQGESYQANTENLQKAYEIIQSIENLDREQVKQLKELLSEAYDEMQLFLADRKEQNWVAAQSDLLQFISTYYVM